MDKVSKLHFHTDTQSRRPVTWLWLILTLLNGHGEVLFIVLLSEQGNSLDWRLLFQDNDQRLKAVGTSHEGISLDSSL